MSVVALNRVKEHATSPWLPRTRQAHIRKKLPALSAGQKGRIEVESGTASGTGRKRSSQAVCHASGHASQPPTHEVSGSSRELTPKPMLRVRDVLRGEANRGNSPTMAKPKERKKHNASTGPATPPIWLVLAVILCRPIPLAKPLRLVEGSPNAHIDAPSARLDPWLCCEGEIAMTPKPCAQTSSRFAPRHRWSLPRFLLGPPTRGPFFEVNKNTFLAESCGQGAILREVIFA